MPVINKGGGGKIGEPASINAAVWQPGPAIAGWARGSPDSITGVGSWGASQELGDLVCSTFHDAGLALSPGSLLVGTLGLADRGPHQHCPSSTYQTSLCPQPLLPVRPIRVLQINLSDFPPTFLPLLTEQGFEADATAAKNVVED